MSGTAVRRNKPRSTRPGSGRPPRGVVRPVARRSRHQQDPFADVWQRELVPLLTADQEGILEATTLLKVLEEKQPGRFTSAQLRTLQRRVSEWRALHGPEREVYFEQEHVPGREGAFDFTNCNELRVTIQGELFLHLLFQFVLSFSKWRHVTLAFSETFEAMVSGLQRAVWALGGTPAVWRSDNLSAATHQLPGGGRELTRRFKAVLDHYDVRSTRIAPGNSNENGVAEKGNDLLKRRLEQALVLRGSRDFSGVAEYEAFVAEVVAGMNRDAAARLQDERPLLKPLPSSRVPEYTTYRATVRCWSTIHFARHTYSVPSRLIGKEVEIRQYATELELRYNDKPAGTIPRIRGDKPYRIDYRHVIWSLVRKPGAFARYRYREELFPSLMFRRAYDALVQARGERADVEYVRVLHLAASTLESDVEWAPDQRRGPLSQRARAVSPVTAASRHPADFPGHDGHRSAAASGPGSSFSRATGQRSAPATSSASRPSACSGRSATWCSSSSSWSPAP